MYNIKDTTIILSLIWSFMRNLNVTHDSMTSVMTLMSL